MNKVYKVIWSKARNCYVVASELAKLQTKSPASGVMSKSVVAGVLACVLSCGAVMPVYAASTTYYSYPNAPQVDSVNPYVSLKVGTSVSNNLDDFFSLYPTYESYKARLYSDYISLYNQYYEDKTRFLQLASDFKNDSDCPADLLPLCDAVLNADSPSSFQVATRELCSKSSTYSSFYRKYMGSTISIPTGGVFVGSGLRYAADVIGGPAISDDDFFNDTVQLDYSTAIATYEANSSSAKAYGENSMAFGKSSVVNGDNSIAIGVGHQVNGNNSGAIGDPDIVNGDNSYVVGNKGQEAFVQNFTNTNNENGYRIIRVSDNEVLKEVISPNTSVITNDVNVLNTASYALAFGVDSSAINTGATAFGYDTVSAGIASTAFGGKSKAFGTNSVAFGNTGVAIGYNSTAFGSENIAGKLSYNNVPVRIVRKAINNGNTDDTTYVYCIEDLNSGAVISNDYDSFEKALDVTNFESGATSATTFGRSIESYEQYC